jgi:hypothetical protein
VVLALPGLNNIKANRTMAPPFRKGKTTAVRVDLKAGTDWPVIADNAAQLVAPVLAGRTAYQASSRWLVCIGHQMHGFTSGFTSGVKVLLATMA